jgi:hypothetical protein
VFAQEFLNFNAASETMTREAALVGNVYYDLSRYGGHETESARAALFDYTEIVLKREWQTLGFSARLDDEAWDKWKSAYVGILSFSRLPIPTAEPDSSSRPESSACFKLCDRRRSSNGS